MFLSCCSPMSSKARSRRPAASSRRDADAARLGQPFEAGCDVHSIPEDVVLLDHYVALINADAEVDTAIDWCRCITLCHAGLHHGRTG